MYAAVNLKRNLRSMYCTIEANDRHEASRRLFATAELLVWGKEWPYGDNDISSWIKIFKSECVH